VNKKLLIQFLILALFVFSGIDVYAEYSEIDLAAITKIDAKDVLTHEDAIVMYSSCDVELKKNWKVKYKIKKRIKLLSEKACQTYGEVHVNYLNELQKIKLLKGYTITPSGEKILAKKITDYMPQKEIPMYVDVAVKVLSMRGLSKGCEIEYTYELKSDDLGLSWLYNDFRMISETIPVKESVYSIKVPKAVTLYHAQNGDIAGPAIDKKGSSEIYTWEARNLEPMKFEENMPPVKSITTWVSVSTQDSWDDYIKGWKNIYRTRAAVSPKIKKQALKLTEGVNSDRKKAELIFNYTQNKIRYLGLEFGSASWVPYSAAKVFKSKYGDCKGKTVLIMAMLKAVGIEAYPVMLNPRLSGPTIKELCNETQFSHVIPVCEINGKLVWMDPTSKAAFGTLPGPLQGVDAMVIKTDGGFYTTHVSSAADNKFEMHAKVVFNADGTASGSMNIDGSGGNSTAYKSVMSTMSKELKDQFAQTLLNQWVPGASVTSYNYSDYSDIGSRMTLEYEFSSDRLGEKINDMIIINPIFSKDPRTAFVKSERFYNIELDVKESSLKKEEIAMPQGYRFDVVPDDYNKATPYFKAYIKHRTDGDTLVRESYFEWLTTKIPKEEYQTFKRELDEFDLWTNKKIILRKL